MLDVVMLTYNHEKFIRQAIESVINQKTEFPYRLIIGEDKSTDNTLKICKELEKKHPDKITLLNRDNNLGEIENFIDVLSKTSAKYIAFCEGDDYWTDDEKIQKQLAFLEANESYGIICQDCFYENQDGVRYKNLFSKSRIIENIDETDLSIKDILVSKTRPIHISSISMQRELLDHIPSWYPQTPILDTPFLFYLASIKKVKYIGDPNCVYRKHDESITSSRGFDKAYLKSLHNMFDLLDKEWDYKHSESVSIAKKNRTILYSIINFKNLKTKGQKLNSLKPLFSMLFQINGSSYRYKDFFYLLKNI